MTEVFFDLNLRLQPKSSKNEIRRVGDGVKAWVSAPPVDGAANEAIVKMIAKKVGVAPSRVQIIRGHTSRDKTLRIVGLTEKEVWERIEA